MIIVRGDAICFICQESNTVIFPLKWELFSYRHVLLANPKTIKHGIFLEFKMLYMWILGYFTTPTYSNNIYMILLGHNNNRNTDELF